MTMKILLSPPFTISLLGLVLAAYLLFDLVPPLIRHNQGYLNITVERVVGWTAACVATDSPQTCLFNVFGYLARIQIMWRLVVVLGSAILALRVYVRLDRGVTALANRVSALD